MSRTRMHLGSCLLLTAVLTFAGGPATADHTGWYVEADLGQSTLSDVFGSRQPKAFDDDSTSASVSVGYAFNRYIGVEGGLHDLGSFDGFGSPCPDDVDTCVELLANPLALCVEGTQCLLAPAPSEAEITGWSLAAVPSYPVTERFSVFAKVGFLDWDSDLATGFSSTVSESFSDTDLLTGLGVRYRFGERWGARLHYQRLDLDLASASLGVSWQF